MTLRRTIAIASIFWVTAISAGHVFLNMKPAEWFEKKSEDKLKIGFLPVTCHLTCPVTHFINSEMEGDGMFEPMKFSGWPELKEAFLSGETKATFILAPMESVSDCAYRRVCWDRGASFTWTEMIRARGLARRGHDR